MGVEETCLNLACCACWCFRGGADVVGSIEKSDCLPHPQRRFCPVVFVVLEAFDGAWFGLEGMQADPS